MVMSTHEGGSGFGLGSGVEPIDERIRDIVMSQITCGILDVNSMMFGTIKEGITKLLDERLGASQVEIAAGQLGD